MRDRSPAAGCSGGRKRLRKQATEWMRRECPSRAGGTLQWEKIIRENMVLVDGEETSYGVKDGKRAVLVLFGAGEFIVP
jgi:hypothetical protein